MSVGTDRAKAVWQDRAELVAWLLSLATPLVLELPHLSPLSSAGSWSPIILYLLIFICAFASFWIRKRRWSWILTGVLAIGCLGGGLWGLAGYRHNLLIWSCDYAGRGRVVVGSDDRLLPRARQHQQRYGSTCSELIEDSGSNTEAIWPREQIIDRYEWLGWRFTLITTLLASAAFFLLETWKALEGRARGRG